MSAADEAYKAAQDEIARVKAAGEISLHLNQESFLALEELPPEIADLAELEWLALNQTQVSDLTPLCGLTGLKLLHLDQTQVSDLTPLRDLSRMQVLFLDKTPVSDLTPLRDLTGLQILYLSQTQVYDLSPIRDLTRMQVLSFTGTQVYDLNSIRKLIGLRTLYLEQTLVFDLRPLLNIPALRKAAEESDRTAGLSIDDCPAQRNDSTLRELYENHSGNDRTLKVLDYLGTLPPWPEPLPWNIPRDTPDTHPEAPSDDPVPVLIWTDDERLDVAPSPPGKDELDDPIRQRLYDRLSPAVEKLWRAGNRYPEIDNPVRALRDMLESPYAEADILGIHLEVSALTDVRDGNKDRPEAERIDPDCLSALANVLRIAPGVTIGHPDVDLLEKRNREHARTRLPETVDEGERRIAQGLASDERLTTERTREYARRTGSAGDSGRVAEIRHGFTKKVVIAMATVAVEMGHAATGFVFGELTVNAAQFLILHKDAIMATAPSWGQTGYAWAEYILIRANEIVRQARKE